ncbi:arogenate dehydratase/prephenate dehydratase 1, chloroplastic-like [Impatiens glandulifera]|uniref:arogenate dehydratase/prephenate dehydratase 1, chloroplastic-like n=1 Tax=Impatiens glandulifera TaxID=253017 RepID=UPI001FB19065|nr:arogenate dehydratase/prephenate dehydratase 1, chloroplastic-like [Impatiens glandulifera]
MALVIRLRAAPPPSLIYFNSISNLNNKRSLIPINSFSPTIIASSIRVAYQGVPGAYSEAAALKAYQECETLACDQFESTFKAVELGLADKAVVPIENLLGGSIHGNYDLLLKYHNKLLFEMVLIINHCLLALLGVIKQDLKRVLSHPQAFAQCEITLNKFGLVRVNHNNTAGAAKIVASKGLRDTGAVASARAANIYGLHIIQEGIHDNPFSNNITRFLVLAREPIIIPGHLNYKTCIVFSLKDEGPEILFKVLALFSLRAINLTKGTYLIESRPNKGEGSKNLIMIDDRRNFDYLFYIDFEASMAEPRAQNAIQHLQKFARFVRVLGSYPRVDYIP